MTRPKPSLLMLALFATLVWATAQATAQSQPPQGELVVSLSSDPTSLFLPRAADRTAANTAWSLYDSLVFVDDEGEIVAALAESWDISEDDRTYTFRLRPGVVFHNGEPFTAESVVATWETGREPSNDYARVYEEVVAVEAVDELTVTMTTAEPDPLFLRRLASNWAMVPPDYIREVGIDAFAAAPVGTGPFRLVQRLSGDRVAMEANPDYWQDGLPRVARLTYRVIPDASTRLAAIQTGEIDIANRLTADEAGLLAGRPGVEVVTYPNDRVYYVGFKNTGSGAGTPLEDRRVRLALNHAVDRGGIIRAIFSGEASLVTGLVVPSNLGYEPALEPYPHDLERARALLAEAGYPEGFAIGMGCPADGYVNINEVCLAIQRSLAQVGVEVSVEFRTTNAFWSEPRYGAVGPMYVDSWSSDVGEALPRLLGALLPDSFYNTWEDERLTELTFQIARTVDAEARAELYRELQRVMYEDPPFIYLYQPNIFEAVRERVQGYAPRPAEEYFLKGVSVED
ncbi:ABC transporter substrate-binding protein [soil metagenome]|nr:ABC transporter substrate-binding protein [Deinococcota bacterium]